eukprot:TRINITY_DN1729_c0_g1_i19.p1 TRINITY_DN1729_c0_g1~~TRINITY_DN1729_c0_g1_i19.p1  ORF type:complete len:141 (+),score=31.26 TRINITY_DN1729_c0_g1_i19:1036-1458(+)
MRDSDSKGNIKSTGKKVTSYEKGRDSSFYHQDHYATVSHDIPKPFTPNSETTISNKKSLRDLASETKAAQFIQRFWRANRKKTRTKAKSPRGLPGIKNKDMSGLFDRYQLFLKNLENDETYKKCIAYTTMFYFFQKEMNG